MGSTLVEIDEETTAFRVRSEGRETQWVVLAHSAAEALNCFAQLVAERHGHVPGDVDCVTVEWLGRVRMPRRLVGAPPHTEG